MSDNKIAVYAICKNEIKNIDNWLSSIYDEVDYIIILDTGSTDGSWEKIQQDSRVYKCEQKIFNPWRFDDARNYSLSIVPQDATICFVSDLDQIVRPGFGEILKKHFSEGYNEVIGQIIDIENGEEKGSILSYNVHLHDQHWFWERPMHESLRVNETDGFEEKACVDMNFIIEHHQDKTKNRNQYLALLEKEYNSNEENTDPFTVIYYANELLIHNQVEKNLEVLIKGIKECEYNTAWSKRHLHDKQSTYLQICINAIINLSALQRYEECKEIIPYLLNCPIETRRKYFTLAELYYNLKEYELSIEYLDKMLKINNTQHTGWTEDDNLYEDGFYFLYVLNYYALGNYQKALEYNNRGLLINPNNEILVFNRDNCLNNDNNKIAIYAITKNEIKFVDKWVESMSEADGIFVLDTGSTDGTYEKLQEYDNVIVMQEIIEPWRFDVARNKAMDMIPKDEYNILMSTDLDEVLDAGWAKPLRQKWISGIHERGMYKYAWSHLSNGEPGRVFQYNKIHSWNWRWTAPVHELLCNINTNSENYALEQELNLFDDIYLHHYPDNTKSRQSYLPLLELRKQENPNDYYGRLYLAHEYSYRDKYEESNNEFKEILDIFNRDGIDKDIETSSCYLFMGDNYVALNDKYKAICCYIKAIDINPTYREPYINLGKLYLGLKQYDLAEFYIKEGIKNSYRHYTWLERDDSWSWEPYDCLAICCFYNNKKRDAISYAAKALSYNSEDQHLIDNYNICLEMTSELELID